MGQKCTTALYTDALPFMPCGGALMPRFTALSKWNQTPPQHAFTYTDGVLIQETAGIRFLAVSYSSYNNLVCNMSTPCCLAVELYMRFDSDKHTISALIFA